MKFFRWNKHYVGWGMTAFIVIVASILVFIMLANFESIKNAVGSFLGAVTPIIYGLIFAYLLTPVVTFFEKKVFKRFFKKKDVPNRRSEKYPDLILYTKNKPRRILSITVTVLLVIGIVVGTLIATIPQLTETIKLLVGNIPSYIENATDWVKDVFSDYPAIGDEITNVISEAGTTLRGWLNNQILPQMVDYLGFLTNGLMSIVGFVLNLVFGLVVAIYCLYSKEIFAAQVKKTIYCMMNVKRANKFIGSVRKIHLSFGNFITGTLIDSFVVGCVTMIAATIFGIPFPVLIAVIMGITNIIPYFGPFIGIVPCLLLVFMDSQNLVTCIVFVVIVIVIQNLNGNVLSPKILGESTGLTSFWVIFAILAGQGLFGFWGLIVGIPVFAVVYSALRAFVSEKLKDKGLPHVSDTYTDILSFSEDDSTPISLSEALEKERAEKAEKDTADREKKKAKLKKTIDFVKSKIGKKKM